MILLSDFLSSSDVMIIKIDVKITIFLENRTESISQFFGASVTWFRYRIALKGQQLEQEVTEWVLYPRESDHAECGGVYIRESNHAECRGVYIFRSEYWGEKNEIEFFV